jgi:hypothetical protein
MAFMFQGRSSASWRWQTLRATKHQQNDRKCWKNSRTHPWRPSLNNPWTRRHVGFSYGVWQEILTENLNMRHIAAKFVPRLLANDQKQWCVSVCLEIWEKANEDPTFISRNVTSDESWFCFPNWKWSWRDDVLKQCLISKGNHKWYWIALRKVTSTVLLKHGKNYGITVYVLKETVLKEMAAEIV